PFPTGGLGERLIAIMNEVPVDARELNPQVSDETWAILKRLLEKDPDDRYQLPEDLIGDLLSLAGKATARAKPQRTTRVKLKKKSRSSSDTRQNEAQPTQADAPSHTPYYLIGISAALLLVAGALFFFLYFPRDRKPDVG